MKKTDGVTISDDAIWMNRAFPIEGISSECATKAVKYDKIVAALDRYDPEDDREWTTRWSVINEILEIVGGK